MTALGVCECSPCQVRWKVSCSPLTAALALSRTSVCNRSQTPLDRSDCEGEMIY